MKKLMLITILVGFLAVPALATPTLGWWELEHPRATHQVWNFTPGKMIEPSGPPMWTFLADEVVNNPNPDVIEAKITADAYDGIGSFTSDSDILVFLEIGNFVEPLAYKEIWVDYAATGVGAPIVTSVTAHDGPIQNYSWIILEPDPDTQPGVDFGIRIFPNPEIEKIWFTLPIDGCLATLDSITVDTICIPAPGAVLLGSIGVGLVGWLRRRRSL